MDHSCIVYLDDILIYSRDLESHQRHVTAVLQRLQQEGLVANVKKCEFHQEEIGFLGFVVGAKGIYMEQERVQAIHEWPEPRSVKDIQVFLGFTGFYRRFIAKYSRIVSPLTDLLKGGRRGPVELGGKGLRAFKGLRTAFTEAPILKHYDPTLPIRVETDASEDAIRAVLAQQHADGLWYLVAYLSRKLKNAELRYSTPESELIAIMYACKQWRHYLAYSAHQIVILTDHLNHKHLASKAKLTAKEAR